MFAHLHVHSEYSLLDGASKIDTLLKQCKELGMKHLAITDHGVMYGVVEFFQKAKLYDIHPIIGCEVYVSKNSCLEKTGRSDGNFAHLVLLAENQTGYKNLIKLASIGYTRGFYYKPRIDYDLLKEYSEGIIGLSACLAGDIPRLLENDDYEGAKELALSLQSTFGENNFFLEIQDHGIEEQKRVNKHLIQLSKETGIELVATNDVHYASRDDAEAHDVLLCIQTAKTVDEENRMKFTGQEFYLKSPAEMEMVFPDNPESLENTIKIAERCNVDFDFETTHLPSFDVPEGYTQESYLRKLAYDGLKNRYKERADDKEIVERLEYELSVVHNMGYDDYYLIVWDFVNYAHTHGIMVGPGRGSGAASIIAYCLNITQIEPLKYNLLFERFLNPERISMPDFDIDFCDERRQEVIDYVTEKYGQEKVCQIITFGSMKARAVIRDVGRALDISYAEVDKLAKMIPQKLPDVGLKVTIDDALVHNKDLENLYNTDPTIKHLLDICKKLEGIVRHSSTHAAGVVISTCAVTDLIPVQLNDNVVTTQFPMGNLEDLGILKVDFLGLRNLTIIENCIKNIEHNYNEKIKVNDIPLDDPNIYKMISQGDTDGVFQLESAGMRSFMKELKPEDFEDIIAGISLYRPGPMDQIPRYVRNKNYPDTITYTDDSLKDILGPTHGCMVYQEQVMQIFRDLAGYSLGRSDLVRRAMGKKKLKIMEEERKYFLHGLKNEAGKTIIDGCIARGISESKGNIIYDEMQEFAKYAFNKAHAAGYALIAVQTAWLKYHYRVEYMAALLNSVIGGGGKIAKYIDHCKKNGIKVLPPDINMSRANFFVVDNDIRIGLATIKNVGRPAVEEIEKAREKKGEFKTFTDFLRKVDLSCVNKKSIESLIMAGAFDELGIMRSRLLTGFELILNDISREKKRNIDGQISIFGIDNENEDIIDNLPTVSEFPKKKLLLMEKEMLGLYISGHPLDQYSDRLSSYASLADLDFSQESELNTTSKYTDGSSITIAAVIIDVNIKYTKRNQAMAFLTLEDRYASIEVIVFPKTWSQYSEMLRSDEIIICSGKVDLKEEEEPKILADKFMPMNTDNSTDNKKLYLKPKNIGYMSDIIDVLEQNPGRTPVICVIADTRQKVVVNKDRWVDCTDSANSERMLNDLSKLLGNENVVYK